MAEAEPVAKKGAAKKTAAKTAAKKAPAKANPVTEICEYEKRIGDAPPPPTVETHGPVKEKADEEELQAV